MWRAVAYVNNTRSIGPPLILLTCWFHLCCPLDPLPHAQWTWLLTFLFPRALTLFWSWWTAALQRGWFCFPATKRSLLNKWQNYFWNIFTNSLDSWMNLSPTGDHNLPHMLSGSYWNFSMWLANYPRPIALKQMELQNVRTLGSCTNFHSQQSSSSLSFSTVIANW